MGLLMQSNFAKSNGIKSDLRIRWSKSSDFGRKSDDSTHQIIKSKNGNGVFNQVKIQLSRAGLVQQQYEVHTKARAAIDAVDYEYSHDARTQSPRPTAARRQLAAGRRELGPREQGEQRTQRVFHGYASCESTHRAVARRAGLGCFLEPKYHVTRLSTSLRGQTRV